jgi:NitT/TauT family transport system substrate-binding protein
VQRKMHAPIPIVQAIILASAALLTACGAPPPVDLRIGVYSAQGYLPYFVMRERGFDKKYGLNFVEIPVAGGAQALEAIVEGKQDVTQSGMTPILTAAEKGLIPDKLVAVAVNSFVDAEHPLTGVLASNNVQSWKDLEGKRIGTNSLDSNYTAAASLRLRQEGVNGYSFVAMGIPNLGLALAGGNVDAVAIPEPYLTQSLLRGDGTLLGWVIGGPPFERMQATGIVFSTDFHRRNPAGVKAFLRGHLEAVRWINDHPDEARAVMGRALKLSPQVAARVRICGWSNDPRFDPAKLDEIQGLLVQAGMQKQSMDSRKVFDEALLREVLKEAR